MKARGICISALIVIDTFFVSFAVGFNSQSVLVVDPSLPPLAPMASPPKTADLSKKPAVDSKLEKAPGKAPSARTSKSAKEAHVSHHRAVTPASGRGH